MCCTFPARITTRRAPRSPFSSPRIHMNPRAPNTQRGAPRQEPRDRAYVSRNIIRKPRLATFRVDIDVATCGEITPLSTLDYLIGSFRFGYHHHGLPRARLYPRHRRQKAVHRSPYVTSIQDFISPAHARAIRRRATSTCTRSNLFHTKMLLKEIDLQNYLFNTDIYELPPKTRLKIHSAPQTR